MRLPGTTPSSPDDTGDIDPVLADALDSGDDARVAAALLKARLLVPVVALPSAGDAEMAVPALVDGQGRRALPVFSSYDALRAWQPDARPVPMSGARVFAGAAAEGYDGVVLDVAGPITLTLADGQLRALAAAARAMQTHPGARLATVEHERPMGGRPDTRRPPIS
ncbi:MAG TPA: SseB family protein [Mycobacteriales bacterium]|nr:SseB family protein [Mycobacteriales bacterium]